MGGTVIRRSHIPRGIDAVATKAPFLGEHIPGEMPSHDFRMRNAPHAEVTRRDLLALVLPRTWTSDTRAA